MNEELQEIYKLLNIEQIPLKRNYWLIRTDSGKYFYDFLENNYVSIGWDEFSSKDNFRTTDEKTLKERISLTYPSEKRPGYIYNQISRFMFEIKKGDMILIPSENSTQIAFGIVAEDFFVRNTTYTISNPQIPQCKFKKCIKVNWTSKIFKEKFDPYLKMLMFTHTTISDINNYKNYINRLLYSNYVIDNTIHSTFNVASQKNISAVEILNFLNLISQKSIDTFNDITGSNFDKNSISLKMSVQSPGPIEFIGYSVGAILIVSAVNLFLFGSKHDIEFGPLKFKSESQGLLPNILKFIKELHSDNQKTLKIKNEIRDSKKQLQLLPSESITQPTIEIKNNILLGNKNIKNEEKYQQISFDNKNTIN